MVGGRALLHSDQIESAMGFRAVTDLSDYTVAELAELIEKAAALIRAKLEESESLKSGALGSFSVVGSEASGAASSAGAPSGLAPPQTGVTPLKSPFDCGFHCKYCYEQCCRPADSHKNHACLEHRHRR